MLRFESGWAVADCGLVGGIEFGLDDVEGSDEVEPGATPASAVALEASPPGLTVGCRRSIAFDVEVELPGSWG